jgi:hypothetical protein
LTVAFVLVLVLVLSDSGARIWFQSEEVFNVRWFGRTSIVGFVDSEQEHEHRDR